MTPTPSTFAKYCKVAFIMCIIGITVFGARRSKLTRKMEPILREYELINSDPYMALSMLEGFANGYAGNGTAVINQLQREFTRENRVLNSLGDLYPKWQSANRDLHLSMWGAGISGVLWVASLALWKAPSPRKT